MKVISYISEEVLFLFYFEYNATKTAIVAVAGARVLKLERLHAR